MKKWRKLQLLVNQERNIFFWIICQKYDFEGFRISEKILFKRLFIKKNQKNDIESKDEKLSKFCELKGVKLKMKRIKRNPKFIKKVVLKKSNGFLFDFY